MVCWDPVGELDGEVAQGGRPVGHGHDPFGAEVAQGQVEELGERVDGGEEVAVASNRLTAPDD